MQIYLNMTIFFKEFRPMTELGGGFKHFLFSPLLGEDSHFDEYFSKGLKLRNHQLESNSCPILGIFAVFIG